MADEVIDELGALEDQLDEVLQEPVVDADDALEVCILAGLVERLGSRGGALAAARRWRDESEDLLEALWEDFDGTDLASAVEEVCVADADEDDVEEAILDVDEHVVAAIWSGHRQAVRELARSVEQTIQSVPDPFASLADVGTDFCRMRAVAEDQDLYAFWFAIADSARWASN